MKQQTKVIFVLIVLFILAILAYSLAIFLHFSDIVTSLFFILILICGLFAGIYSIFRQLKKDNFFTNLIYPFIILIAMFIVLLLALTPLFHQAGCYSSSECWYGFGEMIGLIYTLVYFGVIVLINGVIWLIQKFSKN